jgi:subtilisin family serine protease
VAVTLALALAALPAAGAAPASAGSCQSFGYESGGSPGSGAANDPLFARQWGLDQIHAPQAWARGARGAGAVIAVLDTGADLQHPDLQPNLIGGADLIDPGDNGCPGPQDENGHGTHVAGIAAAVTGNGIGVAGTAPDAKLIPIRVLDEEGSGSVDGVAKGIRMAADRGADVINLSLADRPVVGQLPVLNQDVEDAAAYAWSKGSLIVAAAGNESVPLCSYPAASSNAICVGATDRSGSPTFYSNFPADDDSVGVRAPGGASGGLCEDDADIWSTIWPGTKLDCKGDRIDGYDTLAGTSMSSPFVAGVAAILASGGLTNQQILDCLKRTSSNRGRFDPVYGYGIVDADAATASCGGTWGGQRFGVLGGSGAGDSSAPVVRMRLGRTTLRRLISRGRLRVSMSLSEPASLSLAAYTARRSRTSRTPARPLARLATRTLTLSGGRSAITLKLSRSGRRALRDRRSAVITLAAQARDAGGNASTGSARRTYRR